MYFHAELGLDGHELQFSRFSDVHCGLILWQLKVGNSSCDVRCGVKATEVSE